MKYSKLACFKLGLPKNFRNWIFLDRLDRHCCIHSFRHIMKPVFQYDMVFLWSDIVSVTIGSWNLSATVLSPTSIHLTWVAPCHTQQYHIYYRGTCGSYVDEGRLDTDRQEHMFYGLQEGINYSFTVNQTGFGGGRVLSTGPVYARTFTAGK